MKCLNSHEFGYESGRACGAAMGRIACYLQLTASRIFCDIMASKPAKSKSAWQEGKAPASVDEYCQCLDASRVMSAEDCRAFIASLPEEKRPQTAKALALELLKTGKLTRYQCRGCCKGRSGF